LRGLGGAATLPYRFPNKKLALLLVFFETGCEVVVEEVDPDDVDWFSTISDLGCKSPKSIKY
jgi:hypothetical protein